MTKWFTDGQDSEAEFNLAMGTILRIDANLKEVNHFFKLHDYKGAYETLQVVYSEISPFLKDQETIEMDKEESEIGNDIIKSNIYNPKTRRYMFNSINHVDMRLRKWDRKLRSFMLKYKLYMKMSDNRLAATKI